MKSIYKPQLKITKIFCQNNHFLINDDNSFTQKQIYGVCTRKECKEKLVCVECQDTYHKDHNEMILSYEKLKDLFKYSEIVVSSLNYQSLQDQFLILKQQALDQISKLEKKFNDNMIVYAQLSQIQDIISLIKQERYFEITNEQFHLLFQVVNHQTLNWSSLVNQLQNAKKNIQTTIECLENINTSTKNQSKELNFQNIINQHVNLKKIKQFYLENLINYSQAPKELKSQNEGQIKEFQNQNEVYYGEVDEKSQKHGKGILIQKKGDIIYEGIWQENQLRWGQKTQFNELQECIIFKGYMKDKKMNGQGTKITSSGDFYEGYFKEDKLNGEGYSITNDGEIYKGSFQDNKRHGLGELKHNDGNQYIGSFKNGKKNGDGLLTYKNGDIYSGWFYDDKRHGKGVLTIIKDNLQFKGHFQNDKKDGNFEIIHQDRTMETGMFTNDIKHGSFRLYSPHQQTPYNTLQYNNGELVK